MQKLGMLLKEKKSSATKSVDTGAAYLGCMLVVVAFIALMAKGNISVRENGGVGPMRPSSLPTVAGLDPQRFILNGLLVPSLDADAVPLRWVDPRPAIQ